MSTLDDLFPDAAARRQAKVVLDDRHTMHRLDQLLGDRREDMDVTHRASSRPALVAMVDAAVATAQPVASVPPAPRKENRTRRRRVDLVSLGAAALAAVAVVATVVVGGVQAATASPADEALGVLTADEKTITGVEAGLTQTHQQIVDDIAAGDAQAAALRTALEGVRSAPDPADIPPGQVDPPANAGTIAIADGEALDAALAAVDAYRKGLSAIEVPKPVDPYKRSQLDKNSLEAVAAAIDEAQQHLTALDRSTAALRNARTGVQSAADALDAQLKTFTATFVPAAQQAVDDHPDAGQKLKDAVTAAADAVASAGLMTPDGAATLSAYRTALVALVADQVYRDRVKEDQARQQAADEARRWRQQPRPTPTPDPTEPPADSGTQPPPAH